MNLTYDDIRMIEYAIPCGEYPDLKPADSNVHIHRFACPLMIGEEKAVAWLTAKQTIKVRAGGAIIASPRNPANASVFYRLAHIEGIDVPVICFLLS